MVSTKTINCWELPQLELLNWFLVWLSDFTNSSMPHSIKMFKLQYIVTCAGNLTFNVWNNPR